MCLHFVHSWGSLLIIGPWVTEECSLWMELPEVCLAGLSVGHWCGPCFLFSARKNQAYEYQWVLIYLMISQMDDLHLSQFGLLIPTLIVRIYKICRGFWPQPFCAVLNICTRHKRFIKVIRLCCMTVHCHYTSDNLKSDVTLEST